MNPHLVFLAVFLSSALFAIAVAGAGAAAADPAWIRRWVRILLMVITFDVAATLLVGAMLLRLRRLDEPPAGAAELVSFMQRRAELDLIVGAAASTLCVGVVFFLRRRLRRRLAARRRAVEG
jgi:hypothetical protein